MMHPYFYAGTFKQAQPIGEIDKYTILKTICKELRLDYDKVKNKKTRLSNYVFARQLYGYFCKIYTNDSLESIAKFIHKDHATIIYSVKKINGYLAYEYETIRAVKRLHNIFRTKIINYDSEELDEISNEIIFKYNKKYRALKYGENDIQFSKILYK